jgi:predicted permease
VAFYYHPDALAIGLIFMQLGVMLALILLVYFAHKKQSPVQKGVAQKTADLMA